MKSLRVIGVIFLMVLVTAFGGSVDKAQAALYDSGTIDLAIPDGDEAGIWTGITVSDSFAVSDVSVTLDIGHTWIGDLGVALVGPGGPDEGFIWLIDTESEDANELASGQSYTFTDSAADFLPAGGTVSNHDVISGGSYLPDDAREDPITTFASTFAGGNSQGEWQLYLVDVLPRDEGTLTSWQLDLTPVPIPGAIWLLGSGMVGLVGFRRKFRT